MDTLKIIGAVWLGFIIFMLLLLGCTYIDWATVLTILYVVFLAWVGYMSLVIVYNLIVAVGSDTAKPNFYDGFIIALLLVLIIR